MAYVHMIANAMSQVFDWLWLIMEWLIWSKWLTDCDWEWNDITAHDACDYMKSTERLGEDTQQRLGGVLSVCELIYMVKDHGLLKVNGSDAITMWIESTECDWHAWNMEMWNVLTDWCVKCFGKWYMLIMYFQTWVILTGLFSS